MELVILKIIFYYIIEFLGKETLSAQMCHFLDFMYNYVFSTIKL